jgi:hypothetical protein
MKESAFDLADGRLVQQGISYRLNPRSKELCFFITTQGGFTIPAFPVSMGRVVCNTKISNVEDIQDYVVLYGAVSCKWVTYVDDLDTYQASDDCTECLKLTSEIDQLEQELAEFENTCDMLEQQLESKFIRDAESERFKEAAIFSNAGSL